MEFWVGNSSGTHYATIDAGAGAFQLFNTSHPTGTLDFRAKEDYSFQVNGYYSILNQKDGGVKLYHPGSQGNILSHKFETLGVGVTVTGTTFSNELSVSGVSTFSGNVNIEGGHVLFKDLQSAYFGTHNDLRIWHQGGYSMIDASTGTGSLYIQGKNIDNSVVIRAFNDDALVANFNGSVDLYYDNSKKFETTNTGAVVTGILTATTFSGSGASLTTLNASELDSGTIPDARFPATLPAVSGANLTNLPAPTPADTDVQVTFDVSSNGSSAYRFTGPGNSGSDDNPDIYLVRGQRYRFINGTGSGHPFRIQSDTSGTAYTDGVSGSQSGTQDFNVQHDAPTHLYYQCTIHSGMIGNIYIVGRADGRLGIQGAGSNFTLAADHAGKLVRSTGNGSTITIPQDTFTPGDMISVFNVSTGNNTIAKASGVTLYNTADGTNGNRTLAAKGVCTIVCSASNEFLISGSGLS